MRFRIAIVMILGFLVTGCAGKDAMLAFSKPVVAVNAVPETVFVATTRGRTSDPDVLFGAKRSNTLQFAKMTVSVPRKRKPGTLPFPNPNPDLSRQFAATGAEFLDGAAATVEAINSQLAERPAGQRQLLVFVHGYNVGFAESIFRQAQIRHDFSMPAVGITYSWPSADKIALYLYDRDSAAFAVDGLVRTLKMAAASNAEGIFLLGHSMGTLLTMESLRTLSLSGDVRTLKRLNAVTLAAPDIDVDLFNSLLGDITPRPQPFVIMVSNKDRALAASQRLRGGHPRVGEGSNIEALRAQGLVVMDLSSLDDGEGSINHSTFASSPTMINMVNSGAINLERLASDNHGQSPDIVASGLGGLSDLAAEIIYLPAKVVGVR